MVTPFRILPPTTYPKSLFDNMGDTGLEPVTPCLSSKINKFRFHWAGVKKRHQHVPTRSHTLCQNNYISYNKRIRFNFMTVIMQYRNISAQTTTKIIN